MVPNVQPDVPRNTTGPEDRTLPPASLTRIPQPASWHGWNWLFRPLGVVVALGGGIAAGYNLPMWGWDIQPMWEWNVAPALLAQLWWVPLAMLAIGALAAGLLGSWWAVLIIPIVVNAGITVAMGQPVLNVGSLMWVILPATLGAVIGTLISGWAERRIRR